MGRRFDPDRAHVKNITVGSKGRNSEDAAFSIIVLCHKRTEHLRQVLDALSLCAGIEHASLVFVAHDSSESVLNLIEKSPFQRRVVLKVEKMNFVSSAHAINHNLFLGLKFGFINNNSLFCCVVEDDTILAKDALEFMRSCLMKYGNDKRFRGINSYSLNVNEQCGKGDVVKINYGLGQGWCIDRKNYSRLLEFWTGLEKTHWDYFVEPFIRTGYVISPFYSRVKNIGFDSTGSHTRSPDEFSRLMEKSYLLGNRAHDNGIREVGFPYFHTRKDLIVLSNLGIIKINLIYLLRDISFKLYLMASLGKPKIHYLWRITRNFIDRKFANVSTNYQ